MEPTLHNKANLNALDLKPNARGINRTSGGIGKNEASANESKNKTRGPDRRSDHFNTQSYIFLIHYIFNHSHKFQLRT